MSDYISIKDDRLWQILFDEACVEGKQAERIQKELEKIAVDEKEIIRKPMERIKKRIDEKMESVDYWTKPFDKYEYYDNGFWEGMNEVATIVKEEGGIE